MIVESTSDDIVYSDVFTGVHGNYLKPSIRAAGLRHIGMRFQHLFDGAAGFERSRRRHEV